MKQDVTVLEVPIKQLPYQKVELPVGSTVVGVTSQPSLDNARRFGEEAVLVVLADPEEKRTESREFRQVIAGGVIPNVVISPDVAKWLGTWFQKNGAQRWHVFEICTVS